MRNSDSARKNLYIDILDDFCLCGFAFFECALLGMYFLDGVGVKFGVFG